MKRLNATMLGSLPSHIALPQYDRETRECGIVHIGVGAFHKAHQAVYTNRAITKNGGDWMIAGVSLRSSTARDELEAQNYLYSLTASGGPEEEISIVGSIKEIHVAPEDLDKALSLIARPSVHVVTLTITEKGYCLKADSGELDLEHPDIFHDLESPDTPISAIGFLGASLRNRKRANGQPITIISCDNLNENGKKLERAIKRFLQVTDPETLDWVKKNTTFPSTMVDRIVPATTAQDRDDRAARLGCLDQACVKTEAFSQWVIEQNFAGPVPDWQGAGATYVNDVHPYELAKLRLLNGPHSAIAYLGALAGHEFAHQVMDDPMLAGFIEYLMKAEIAPMLLMPAGFDLCEYTNSLRERFRNAALEHRTLQIAMDGSQKLPQRIVPILEERLAKELPVGGLLLVIAAWMAHVSGRGYPDNVPPVEDPMAGRLSSIAEAKPDSSALVMAYLQIGEIFGHRLEDKQSLLPDLITAFDAICQDAHGAIRSTMSVNRTAKYMGEE